MPEPVTDILFLITGIALLIGGGETLVRGAVVLARRLGVPLLIVGLTVVAFGTSAPELALNIVAALNGNTDLSFGNIVGSNIANIGLILGIAALVAPLAVNASVIKRELPAMILATLVTLGLGMLAIGEPANRFGAIDGAILLAGFVTFLLVTILRAKSSSEDEFEQTVSEIASGNEKIWLALVMVLVGLGLLALGGKLTETGATGIARALGMSDEMIGLTVVAIATSLPELVTSIVAVRKGQVDIAVGNVVGSNLFNLLLVLGVTSLIETVPLPAKGDVALYVMVAFALILIPMTRTKGRTLSRVEGGVLLVSYLAYMTYEVWGVVAGG